MVREQLLDSKYWNDSKEKEVSKTQFTNKFKYLENLSLNKKTGHKKLSLKDGKSLFSQINKEKLIQFANNQKEQHMGIKKGGICQEIKEEPSEESTPVTKGNINNFQTENNQHERFNTNSMEYGTNTRPYLHDYFQRTNVNLSIKSSFDFERMKGFSQRKGYQVPYVNVNTNFASAHSSPSGGLPGFCPQTIEDNELYGVDEKALEMYFI